MKTRYLLIISLLFLCCTILQAANPPVGTDANDNIPPFGSISVSELHTHAHRRVRMSVQFDNIFPISSLYFGVVLPEDFYIVRNDAGKFDVTLSDRTAGLDIHVDEWDYRYFSISLYAQDRQRLEVSSGTFLEFLVDIPDDKVGEQKGYLEFVTMTNADTQEEVYVGYPTFSIFIDPLPGDANDDGRVDYADLDAMLAAACGRTPAVFAFELVDHNGDGHIDIRDIPEEVRLITRANDVNADNQIDVGDILSVYSVIRSQSTISPIDADINYDGHVDAKDVQKLRNMLLEQ